MKQQTTVEWLVNQVEDFIGLIPVDIIEKAKAMEEKQHENTWIEGQSCKMPDTYIGKEKTFQQYYTETYGKS
jgi:hypothetical protein